MSESPKSPVFRGDHPDLLDHLVSACNEHKANKPLEGFGRDLVPFFAPGESLGPLPTKKSPPPSLRNAKGSKTRKSCSSERARPAPVKADPKSVSLDSDMSAALRASNTPQSTAPRHGRLRAFVTPAASVKTKAAKPAALKQPAACPAFFSSPKPEAIPLPTVAFLSKASPAIVSHCSNVLCSASIRGVTDFAIPAAVTA